MGTKKTIKSVGKSGKIFFWTMMTLPFLQFIIFYLVVNFNNVALAFKTYDKNTGVTAFAGLKNFAEIFKNWGILSTYLRNSIVFFLANLLIVTPLTLFFAYYIFRKFKFSGFFKIVLFLPSVICCMVFLIFYKNFANYALIDLLEKWGIKIEPFITTQVGKDGHTRMWIALLLFSIIMGYSGSILLYLNSMSQISTSVLEAAKIDGASEVRSFISVIVPGCWGTVVSLVSVSMAGMLGNQAYLFNLFGGSAPSFIQTIGYHMYLVINPDMPDYTQYPYVSALGVFFTLFLAPLTIGVRKLLTAYGPRED